MAVSNNPVFPQGPFLQVVNLAAATACTTRGPTATASLAGANIIQFVNTTTNGARIDSITVNACSTSITAATAANIVQVWIWDGTNAYLGPEIAVTAVTPSATAVGFTTTYFFPQPLMLPSTYKLYASVTVTTTASTTAIQATAYGAVL